MKELELLKSMWAAKIKRKTDLIVPKISYNSELNITSLNNESWHFNVPYAFRDALDIKYETRKKDKKPYMVWTQGARLDFKDGDKLTSKDKKTALQVQFANPMGWDSEKNEMHQGSVVFDAFNINNGIYVKTKRYECNQMDFLKTLITGVMNN